MSKNPMNQRGASSGSWTTTPLIAAKEQWTGSAAKAIDRGNPLFCLTAAEHLGPDAASV